MHHHDAGCFAHTFSFSTPCDDIFTKLVCATHWLYMHLYMLAYMSMHESCLRVCRPYFNTMKLWTFDPNQRLSLANIIFCLLACLPLCPYVCSHPTCYACHIYLACSFCILLLLLPHIPSVAYLLVFLSLPLHVHTWSEDTRT